MLISHHQHWNRCTTLAHTRDCFMRLDTSRLQQAPTRNLKGRSVKLRQRPPSPRPGTLQSSPWRLGVHGVPTWTRPDCPFHADVSVCCDIGCRAEPAHAAVPVLQKTRRASFRGYGANLRATVGALGKAVGLRSPAAGICRPQAPVLGYVFEQFLTKLKFPQG